VLAVGKRRELRDLVFVAAFSKMDRQVYVTNLRPPVDVISYAFVHKF
jgi:hypothetical protein